MSRQIDQLPTKILRWRTSVLARWLLVLALSLVLLFITATMVFVPFSEPAVGALIVTTVPAGAQILLDDRVIAQSPAKLEDVPAGSHNIKVIKSGFNAIEYNLSINKKQTFTLPVISLLPYRAEAEEVKGSPQERIQEFRQLAQAAYERGDYVSPIYHNALYFTNAVLAIDANDSTANELSKRIKQSLLREGELAEQKGDWATSLHIYNQLTDKFTEDQEIENTFDKLQIFLAARRTMIPQLLQQSEIALNNGRLVEPANNSAYYFISQILAMEPDHPGALRLQTRLKETLAKQAETLLIAEDYFKATEAYQELLDLFPLESGWAEPIDQLHHQIYGLSNLDNPAKRREVGLQKYFWGDYLSASVDLDFALKNGVDDAETLYYFAAIHWRIGQKAKAEDFFQQVLQKQPTHAATLTILGQLAEDNKDSITALDYYQRAAKSGGSRDFSLSFLNEKIQIIRTALKQQNN